MLESALRGSRRYWTLITGLLVLIAIGAIAYAGQFIHGLGLTGMSRDVVWGLYVSQLTFLVGVAASAVMVVLPYYLHHFKAFGKMTILGEFLAITAVVMCILFVTVDLGQPMRFMNIFLHPTPHSMLFWDTVVLFGYLTLNVIISRATLRAERAGMPPPKWVKPLIYLSVPWAVSIHTVTAFLYCGLAGRTFWESAILAPRFLASAFAAGPALLILLALVVRRTTKFDPGLQAIDKLAEIVAYAMAINAFFILLEVFTTMYSHVPEDIAHYTYAYLGLHGHTMLVPWSWASVTLAVVALVLLIVPRFRRNHKLLVFGCIAVYGSLWIDKGLAMVLTGFVPSPLDDVTQYYPTGRELLIALGIYALGALVLTVLYKIAISVREELQA